MFGPSRRHLLRLLERERDAHAAERARLVDQICHLAGKPWTPPPARDPQAPHADEWAREFDPIEDPEQLPV